MDGRRDGQRQQAQLPVMRYGCYFYTPEPPNNTIVLLLQPRRKKNVTTCQHFCSSAAVAAASTRAAAAAAVACSGRERTRILRTRGSDRKSALTCQHCFWRAHVMLQHNRSSPVKTMPPESTNLANRGVAPAQNLFLAPPHSLSLCFLSLCLHTTASATHFKMPSSE